MKKLFVLITLFSLTLIAARCQGSEYRVLGYCEADELYYVKHKESGEVLVLEDCEPFCKFFKHRGWCPEPEPEPEPVLAIPPKPLFPMQLLEIYDPPKGWLPYCMVMTEGGVSVERQQVICGWIADNHPCGGMVYDDDTWVCDSYGYYRQPLPVLKCLWARHLAGQRDQASFDKCHEQ